MVKGFYRNDGARWVPMVLRDGEAAPVTLDQHIRSTFPTTFARTYDVGPGKTYSTIEAAKVAAREASGVSLGRRFWGAPWTRQVIRVWPGEYRDYDITAGGNWALIGMGSKPEDVRIWHDEGRDRTPGVPPNQPLVGGNIVSTTGSSAYISNVWLDHAHPDPGWHSMRDAGVSGDVGLRGHQRRTVIFDRVKMTSHPLGKAGKCAVDATPVGVDMIFYRCEFLTPGQPQAVNLIPNYSPSSTEGTNSFFIFDCSVSAGADWYADNTLPNNGGVEGQLNVVAVGLVDAGSGRQDELWWIDGPHSTYDVLPRSPKYENSWGNVIVLKKGSPAVSTAKFHIDPAVPPGRADGTYGMVIGASYGDVIDPMGVVTAAGGRVDRIIPAKTGYVDFPLDIVDGTSAKERAFFGPNPETIKGNLTLRRSGTTTKRSLPAGRMYYIPIPAMSSVGIFRTAQAEAEGTGSVMLGVAYTDTATGKPNIRTTDSFMSPGALSMAGAGTKRWNISATPFFPGHKTVWNLFGTVGATVEVDTLLATGTGTPVYYADGYTGAPFVPSELLPLPAGEPYPVVTLVNSA